MDRDLRRYRRLLRLLPSPVRAQRGPAMEMAFRDMCEGWRKERGSLGFRFWSGIAVDTLRTASAEWAALIGNVIRPSAATTGGELMFTFVSDVRYALRQLIRQPLYSGMVILLMALGIAGNAAVFRVFNGLFLRPLPFPEAERLVDLDETAPEWNLPFLNIAYRDYATWSESNSTFESMAVYGPGGGTMISNGEPTRISYLRTTWTLGEVLRLTPAMGRYFTAEEDQPDGPRAAVLSYGFWERQFGGDPQVIGQSIDVNGNPLEIVGVLPREAAAFTEVDMWVPLQQSRDQFFGWGLSGTGRMKPGITIEAAQADLSSIHAAMLAEFERDEPSSPVVNSLRDRYLGTFRLGTGFLLGAVVMVLLIACANIAGLMFARSFSRNGEISVRLALGAPRGRIVRQLLTEGLTLAMIGAGAGTLLGIWSSGLLVSGMASSFPSWVSFDLDGRFFGFVLLMTAGSGLLFALLPAWKASSASTPGSSSRAIGSRARQRATSFLVAGEVALALALLVLGGLSLSDVRSIGQTDPGFNPEGLATYSINLSTQKYALLDRLAFADEYLERLEAIPGVERAAATSHVPMVGHSGTFLYAAGEPPRSEEEGNPVVLNRTVSPGYFEATGVRLVAGRLFDEFDGRTEGDNKVIVNETFVRTHLSHLADPIGARVAFGTSDPGEDGFWMTVVGVTADVKHYGLDQEMRPGIYQPWAQNPFAGFSVALRYNGDLAGVMSAARAVTAEMDSEVPMYGSQRAEEQLAASMYTRRATSWLFGSFSTVALLLAVAGIWGVIAYSTGQRAQEISIRMAMGADRGIVLGQIVRQGMVMVAIGVMVGLGVALAASGAISGMLVSVDATDPTIYGLVTALLVVVALTANYLPARKAVEVDPMRALRGE